ncbi:MAG: flagellar biosynthesis protein FlhB [Endozoicomonas sp. (ex Botrylloides leachii)]|nr:flagellar biosynthesis protein FlhB [Endozoicomonas sp. (ex Botrylloides leachii)]
MAEEQQHQERSEEPTERKIKKSQEEGQVPRSRELVTASLIAGAIASFAITGHLISEQLQAVMKRNFQFDSDSLKQDDWLQTQLVNSFSEGFTGVIPMFFIVFFSSVMASIMLGGWLFSTKLIKVKGERLNPIKGLGRMFSIRSLVEVIKSIAKITLLAFSLWLTAQWFFKDVLALNRFPVMTSISLGLDYLIKASAVICFSLIIIFIIDVPFQKWNHMRKLRMTHKELKDESKETEGQPEVRSKVREKQQEIAGRRMMEAVPGSDIIITNPTHFAVALRYDLNRAKAPYLVAKGVDRIALRICAVGREYNRPVVQSPVLARVIFHTTDLNQEIADELYIAVAQVLAYVKHLDDYRAGRFNTLPEMIDPDIPAEFREKWDKL